MIKILCTVLLAVALTVAFLLTPTKADPVEIGQTAPKLKAKDQDGKEVDLAAIYAQGWTLVYFYPKADTPGCTKQGCSLRDAYAELTEKGVTVIGVSMDTPESQKAFKEKYKLPFTLLADKEGEIVKGFGVPMIRLGLASRQAFLVDKEGKVVWQDLKASTDEQAADVLKALAALK
jgi:thioredoxin-dependent peroxiredoxin